MPLCRIIVARNPRHAALMKESRGARGKVSSALLGISTIALREYSDWQQAAMVSTYRLEKYEPGSEEMLGAEMQTSCHYHPR